MRHTIWLLVVCYGLAVVSGIRNIRFWEPSVLDVCIPIVLTFALGWWAVVDARRRRHPVPMLSRGWFYLFAPLVVPGYLFWSRGWRGVGWMLLHVVGWYVVAGIVMYFGGLVVFGDEWLRAM